MIRATAAYVFIAVYVLLLGPVSLLWNLVTGDDKLLYILARFCIRAAGLICGVRVEVQGKEKIAPDTNYLFLSNHQSNFDGPVLFHVIPRNCRALVKAEMMRLPVLSLLMRRVGFVPIERLNPKRAQAGIDLGAQRLSQGYSFIAFPEGTRSRSGQLGDFKKGPFIMAIKAQAPILPVTILNSSAVQPPGKYSVIPGCIRVIFHEPISTAGMGIEDRNLILQRTRNAIASGLNPGSGSSPDIGSSQA